MRILIESQSKILFIATGLLFLTVSSFGQSYIRGKITDRHQSLPAVTVLLHRIDSTLVKGAVTDATGEFIFEPVASGHYLISASMVGYAKFFSLPIVMGVEPLIVPEILLVEEATALGEVVVRADKQQFTQKSDRLVINMESSVTSSGNTILEVLQKSPGVVVNSQSNSISMQGKSGVQIMINNKMIQAPLDVVLQMLAGMSASNVERIEFISTPSATQDAEGNGGIINIVTKRNEDVGTRGSVGVTFGYRWAETVAGNSSLNHRTKKIAYFLEYSIIRNHNLHILEISRRLPGEAFDQPVHVLGRRENVTTQQNLSTGLEWNLSAKTSITLGLTGYRRDWRMKAENHDVNQARIDSTLLTHMNIQQSNIWQSATGTIGLYTKINSRNEIGFNVDYLYYHNDNPSRYQNTTTYAENNVSELSKIDLQKITPLRFFIAKADYRHSVNTAFNVDAGFKIVSSNLDNDVMVQRSINEVWTIDPLFSNQSNLKEQIGSAYVSTQWDQGTTWRINGGIRYEYTQRSGYIHGAESAVLKRHYGYFFPTFTMTKNFNPGRDLQFSYARRITRPTYNDIASYATFWSPNTFTAANTTLLPAISDAVKVGYHVNQWMLSLQYVQVKNEIVSLQPEVDPVSNALTYRSQNLQYVNTLALNNFFSFNPTAWWEVQSNTTVQYQELRTAHLKQNVTLMLYGLNFNLVNVITLPNNFSIEISGTYQSKTRAGITQFLPSGSLNAGVEKDLGKKGILRLAMDDILYTNYWRIHASSPENNLDVNFHYNWHNQFIRLSYTRNLGNAKLKAIKTKSGSEEERKRVD